MHTDNNAAATIPAIIETAIASVPATDAPAKPAKPARVKRAAKPAPEASKPAAPVAKPASDKPTAEQRAATDAAEQKRCDDLRDRAAAFYNGASLAAHQRKPAKRDDYAARIRKPVQRAAGGNPSARDESGLALILSVAKRDGSFDPCACNLDLGIASRLASVGFLSVTDDGSTFALTKPGRERANLVVKRAA